MYNFHQIWILIFPRYCSNIQKIWWTVLYDFVANLALFLTVKKFRRSVKFWPSYSKLKLARFLGHSVYLHTITMPSWAYDITSTNGTSLCIWWHMHFSPYVYYITAIYVCVCVQKLTNSHIWSIQNSAHIIAALWFISAVIQKYTYRHNNVVLYWHTLLIYQTVDISWVSTIYTWEL